MSRHDAYAKPVQFLAIKVSISDSVTGVVVTAKNKPHG